MIALESTDLTYFLDNQENLAQLIFTCVYDTFTEPRQALALRLIHFFVSRYDMLLKQGFTPVSYFVDPYLECSGKEFRIELENLFDGTRYHIPGGTNYGKYGCKRSVELLIRVLENLKLTFPDVMEKSMTSHFQDVINDGNEDSPFVTVIFSTYLVSL